MKTAKIFLVAALFLTLTTKATAQQPPFAANLTAPIGLEVDDTGNLWVVEVGTGNDDGRISVVTPDGTVHPFLEGLRSVPEADGSAGTYNLERINGQLYFTHGLGTVMQDGYLLRIDPSGFTPGEAPKTIAAIDTVANVGAFALAGGLPENNLYDLTEGPEGDLYLVDAGANAVFRLDADTGALSLFATFDPIPNPTPVGPPVIQAVPTNIVFDGERFYVSAFTGFPFVTGLARVYEIDLEGEVSVFQNGLSLVTALTLDPNDGTLLATQMGRFDLESGFLPNTGSIVRLDGATVDTVLADLLLPTGLHFAPDGDLFVASIAGLVFKLPLAAATAVEPGATEVPARFFLEQNYPNPFNPTTDIRYELKEAGHVSLQVFDGQGREVATLVEGNRPPGKYEATWRADGLPSGVYVYRLQVGAETQSLSMMLVK